MSTATLKKTQPAFDLPTDWMTTMGDEIAKPYMADLARFLAAEESAGQVIYPEKENLFAAFNETPFSKVRVVILGQDPYHGPGQAHGLSFSVRQGIRRPPSLLNIYKEIARDFSCAVEENGDLTHWAKQGVLLLNATLSVRAGAAGSHQNKGWELFTDAVIRQVSEGRDRIVFLLWGSYAQKKAALIDRNKHLILEAPHPSPLSAHRGFIGCGHFSKANEWLKAKGLGAIEWQRKAQV